MTRSSCNRPTSLLPFLIEWCKNTRCLEAKSEWWIQHWIMTNTSPRAKDEAPSPNQLPGREVVVQCAVAAAASCYVKWKLTDNNKHTYMDRIGLSIGICVLAVSELTERSFRLKFDGIPGLLCTEGTAKGWANVGLAKGWGTECLRYLTSFWTLSSDRLFNVFVPVPIKFSTISGLKVKVDSF